MKKTVLLILWGVLLFHTTYAAIFDCNSTSDAAGNSSTRTLRYCITQANLTAAKDTINFSVSGTFSAVGSNYPVISYPLCINGFSAPGSVQGQLGTGTRVLNVILNGPGNSTVYGFQITANDCEIKGLVIQDFYKGVYINGGDNNWIWGCYIGTAANGLSIAASTTCYDDGIAINSNGNNNIIGTNGDGSNDANEGNLISGNGDSGVQYTGEGVAINEGGAIGTDCTGNRIAGNFIGTNETGTAALYPGSTADAQRGSGIQINYSTANIIGTNADGVSDALERNVISGNSDCGIVLAGATGNKIKGNYLGTTKTGLVGLPNYGNEGTKINAVQVTVKLASNDNYIGTDGDGINDNVEGNILGSFTIANGSANISYNYAVFNSASTGNRYSGNYFGIGADGTTALDIKTTGGPYIDKCIYISSSSTSTIVGTNGDGTSDSYEANYFGNSGIGVAIDNSNSCIVAGNYFGLGTNLTTAETLTTAGTYILNSTSCRIGSSAANNLERNYYCNSSLYGIWVDGNATSNNDLNNIRYNTIGIRPDGVTAANGYHGIYVYKNSNSNTIDYNIITKNGTASSSGAYAAIQIGAGGGNEHSIGNTINNNIIYKNIGAGIGMDHASSQNNLISQNSIYNNGNGSDATGRLKLGIDLQNDGVNANDYKDPDGGPNRLVNFPLITSAVPGSASCTELVSGTFNSETNDWYVIELYANDVCNGDTSGTDYYSSAGNNYGEGKTYLGSTGAIQTAASTGDVNWSITVPLGSISGKYLTAIARMNSGATINNTGEFSPCYYAAFDCGDAPDSYRTLLASCGPTHENISSNLTIGSLPTADNDGMPSAPANLDTDEGVSTFATVTANSTSYTLPVSVTNNSGTTANIYAWFDINKNGSFEASEYVSANVASTGTQTISLVWDLSSYTCGSTLTPGVSYIRVRLTTGVLTDNTGTATVDERCYGLAIDGEVEDYKLYINGIDYGDLPNTYPTANVVAYEDTATAKVWAGITRPDRECSQNYSADATGDGTEEDGLTTSIGPSGSSYNWVIRLNANQANKTVYFGLWLDWDGNQNFTSGIDAFYSGSAVVNGVTNVNVSVFAPFGINNSGFRLIVSDAPLTSGMYNATITNGEIEDWLLLRILGSSSNILMGSRQAAGNLLKWKNTADLPVTNYTIERSTNNLSWTTLGSVIPLGNNASFQYTYTDANPEKENYYRVKIVLADSSYQYSNILPLFDKNNVLPVIMFPNPATTTLTIQTFNSNYNALKIFDLTGRLVLSQEINSSNTVVNISNIAPGTHLIKFITKDGAEETQRFVKLK